LRDPQAGLISDHFFFTFSGWVLHHVHRHHHRRRPDRPTSKPLALTPAMARQPGSMSMRPRITSTASGLGDSIAINGACMTVTSLDAAAGSVFTVDVSAESLDAHRRPRRSSGTVNLEQALRAQRPPGGPPRQLATSTASVEVTHFAPVGESWTAADRCATAHPGEIPGLQGLDHGQRRQPDGQHRRRPPTGSTEIGINLIPHTIENTVTSVHLKPGGTVNLEIDLIARYVERMLGAEGKLAP
jgi:riboflavin synthase